MMKNSNMQNLNEMMSKMSESEKKMMSEKMMGMCMCHDCRTMKDCSMNMDCSMNSQKGLFCSMGESKMPKTDSLNCICTSCQVPSDMGMSMMNSPCMSKK